MEGSNTGSSWLWVDLLALRDYMYDRLLKFVYSLLAIAYAGNIPRHHKYDELDL